VPVARVAVPAERPSAVVPGALACAGQQHVALPELTVMARNTKLVPCLLLVFTILEVLEVPIHGVIN
jgi:hypothetical protein